MPIQLNNGFYCQIQPDDRNMYKKSVIVFLSFLFCGTGSSAYSMTSAQEVIKTTASQVISALRERKDELTQHPERLDEFVESYILPHFDFIRMSRMVLGKYWHKATVEERKQFTYEFQQLLIRTYASAMLGYSDEKIIYLPFKPDANVNKATVKTEVERAGGPPIPVNYSLVLNNDQWKVYDVVIDGVSLVINYRTSFADEIKRTGDVKGLIVKLQEKNTSELNE